MGGPKWAFRHLGIALPSEKSRCTQERLTDPRRFVKPLALTRGGTGKAALWVRGSEGLVKSVSMSGETEALWAFLCESNSPRKAPGLGSQAAGETQAAVGLGPGLTGPCVSNQFIHSLLRIPFFSFI